VQEKTREATIGVSVYLQIGMVSTQKKSQSQAKIIEDIVLSPSEKNVPNCSLAD
jgi:hypothetical protein